MCFNLSVENVWMNSYKWYAWNFRLLIMVHFLAEKVNKQKSDFFVLVLSDNMTYLLFERLPILYTSYTDWKFKRQRRHHTSKMKMQLPVVHKGFIHLNLGVCMCIYFRNDKSTSFLLITLQWSALLTLDIVAVFFSFFFSFAFILSGVCVYLASALTFHAINYAINGN